MKDVSFITAHFHDFDWIQCWLDRIIHFTDYGLIREFLVVNQDRTKDSHIKLARLNKKVRVLEFPPNQRLIAKQGHDHAHVLNLAQKEAQGKFVCIMDSDCHPISSEWLGNCQAVLQDHDAIAAVDYYQYKNNSALLTHPCFIMLDHEAINFPLYFDEGLFEQNMDTGRLIGKQIEQAGRSICYAHPKKAFRARWGFIYLDTIYNHQRGSYSGGDERLKRQNDWRQAFFKKILVSKGGYDLPNVESFYFQFRFRTLQRTKKKVTRLVDMPHRLINKIKHL
ncbi:MAG: glycosyltransferase family 2 protein [Syntrophomonadaceae bacterium]|nr:glycosyltransferase family 2 protein [Syntrophomonadaceae bacterium]